MKADIVTQNDKFKELLAQLQTLKKEMLALVQKQNIRIERIANKIVVPLEVKQTE